MTLAEFEGRTPSLTCCTPLEARLSPRPSCMPRMTGMGMRRATTPMRPVAPKNRMQEDTKMPAAMICGMSRAPVSASATAAMVFIGCTGMGMSNNRPVMML